MQEPQENYEIKTLRIEIGEDNNRIFYSLIKKSRNLMHWGIFAFASAVVSGLADYIYFNNSSLVYKLLAIALMLFAIVFLQGAIKLHKKAHLFMQGVIQKIYDDEPNKIEEINTSKFF